MEDGQSLDQQIEVTFQRLRELLERSDTAPEALEALAASLEELKARAQEQVAERMAAMEALAAERTFASTVLDTVGALVVVLDREGCIVRFNRMCEQVTGYAFEEIKGRPFWDFLLVPEEVAPVQATFDDLRSGHFPNEFENYWVARDGSRRLIAWTNTAIPGPDGSPEYIISTGLDITARRQAESQREAALAEREQLLEENRRQRQFLEQLLEAAPIGVAVVRGPEHRYEFVNVYYRAVPGIPASMPMVGRTIAEVFPGPVARGSLLEIEAVYRTGQTVSVREYESNVGPGREHTYWDSDRVPLKAPDGSVEGVLIVAREVTEEVLARRQVAALAARDEAILNSLAEGIITFDPDGNILMMNPAALRMYGFERVEQAQRPLADRARMFERRTLDGRPLAADEWPVARALRGETVRDFEAQARRVDTGLTWIGSYSCTPVRDAAGGVIMGVLTVRDITAQKQAEQERERLLAQMQAKNEELQSQSEEQQSQTEELEAQAEELHFQTLNLEEERARLRAIIDSAPEAILVADERGEVVLANPAAERLLAASAQGGGGPKNLGRVTRYRPDRTPYQLHELLFFRAAVHRETQRDIPMVLRWPDGQWRDVLASAAPILDSHGRTHGAVAVYQDITERRRAESQREAALEELRETRDYLDNLLTYANAPIIVWDPAFKITRFNGAFERLTGLKAGDVLGRELNILFPEDRKAEAMAYIRRAAAGERWETVEIPILGADGTVRTVLWNSATLYAADGATPVATIAQGQDITERKRAESQREAALEALRETRDYLDNLLTYANAPIIVWDPAFRITRFNGAFERLTGLKAGDVCGRELDILFPEDRKAEAMAYIRRAAAGERWETVEIPILGADGTVRTVLWNSATLYAADGVTPVATIAQGQDITERVQAEAGLKAALAEKEVLMREIYHRVKNNVQSLIYLMDMQADYIPDEATRQMIRELQERARAMALVHEKLYQSQNLAQIDFGDYLYDLVDNLSHAFGAGRPIVWHIDVEDIPLGVDTAIPCGLIVSELLTNALKYAFPGGRPCTERGETDCTISVASRVDGDQITLLVADNGVGLLAEVDWATTKTLGLQLIGILARHQLGGQVEVDRHAGTSFKITFTDRERKRK